MKHLHRDNFRHLTGLGRDFAGFIDYVLGDWTLDNGQEPPTGNLQVWRDATEFRARFSPHDENPQVESDIAGHELTRELMLSIIVECNGLREVTVLPLLMVVNGAPDYSNYHQVYQHHFVRDGDDQRIANSCYTGVTKRGWRTRWSEHLRSAESGSHYRFHRAIRQWQGVARATTHMVVALCPSESAAMDIEEGLVERDSLYPLGLNMIPGGRSGLAYLRKIGAIGANERVGVDDRQSIINRFFERATRKGLPNPLAAANWLDAHYAERVICAGPDRLKAQQIRDARFFASMGRDAADIAQRVGARNVAQIERVLSGSTYSRIV